MKLLITGMCGFVASQLALWFRENKPEIGILGIDKFSRAGSGTNPWKRISPAISVPILLWAIATAPCLSLDARANNSYPRRHTIYIGARKDDKAGSGTKLDPFDGSTAARFDSIMDNLPLGTHVILERGAVFLTNGLKWPGNSRGFTVKNGMQLSGNGAIVRLASYPGSWTKDRSAKHVVVGNRYFEAPVNHVTIEDLTIDANWQNLNAPGANKAVMCAFIYGSHNTYRYVHAINMYGDSASSSECFSLGFQASRTADAVDCRTEHCILDHPRGDYQAGMTFFGWDNGKTLMRRSCAVHNKVLGRFESGGINLAAVNGFVAAHNYFCDSQGIHHDTNSADYITIRNNVFDYIYSAGVIFEPVPLDRSHIVIQSNRFRLVNNVPSGHTYGIGLSYGLGGEFRHVQICRNTFFKEEGGLGYPGWRALYLGDLNQAIICDNRFDPRPMEYTVEGRFITTRKNRTFTGTSLSLHDKSNLSTDTAVQAK